MKRFFLYVIMFVSTISAIAQTLDDVGRMSIYVTRPNNSNVPQEAMDILEDRMHQILTTNGIADNDFNKRFALSAVVSVIKKDIISGSPARVSQTLEIAFYIKDVKDHKEYGSTSINSVGVGLNENKAYIMAFNNIKPNNSRIQKMIDSSKELIIAYYRTNIDKIIADAYQEANQGNFNRALYLLAQVPDVCTDCTQKCRAATLDLYQRKIDSEGLSLLQSAKSVWAAEPNADGATKATRYLSKINLMAACQAEVTALLDEMKEKVKDDERKAWEFEMQQYADEKAREQRDFDFKVQKYKDRQEKEAQLHKEALEREARAEARAEEREKREYEFAVQQFNANHARDMAIVEACRQVALEEAKNQH